MFDYKQKYNSYLERTLYFRLPFREREFVKCIAFRFKLTFQEFRQVVNAERDLEMWGEITLRRWWKREEKKIADPSVDKKTFLNRMNTYLSALRGSAKRYSRAHHLRQPLLLQKPVIRVSSTKKVFGPCPVASPKTVCCQLQTIDAVENCIYGCSYCCIQTFYTDRTVINSGLHRQLAQISLSPHRYYHFGSGQASDSLALGNSGGILDDLCSFAARHPNVLLELKTKSKNINYFLEHDIPSNVVCSWSLNPEVVIKHEEHFTASLKERLAAARKLADHGIKVAFHFHPIIYYQGWYKDYPAIANRLIDQFTTNEVLFLSFGSMTLIKPLLQKIRNLDFKTKILQMELVADPHGKWTYPDHLKVRLFKKIYSAFKPWQGKVYMYLCMEKAEIWKEVFGYVYQTNSDFEHDFACKTIGTIHQLP